MFKTATAKLAHNAMIPALAGNSRLQPLQDVITAEKLVLQSLQRVSTGFDKSSEALKAWATGEGEDLEDTFSACSTLLSHWISSLTSFALHVARIRESLKAVRSREETLDEMHRRRKSLISKALSADRKLNKMGNDNKNLRQQTDLLTNLREHIRAIDTEIMNEESSLGDWKRFKAREWMGVLFGGLLECSEKGMVVASFGRTVIGHVSTEKTRAGLPRAHYSGKSQVKSLVEEAEQKIRGISFVGEIGDKIEQPLDGYHPNDVPGNPPSYPGPLVQPITTDQPQPYPSSTLPNSPPSNPFELDDFGEYNTRLRTQTYTPGQKTFLPSLDQMSPFSLAGSRFSLLPRGNSGFTPGHQFHLSQSSIASESDSIVSYTPPAPMSQLPNIPHIRLTSSVSGSDIT